MGQPVMTSPPAQQPIMGMNQPMMGTNQPMMGTTQPMMGAAQQPMMSSAQPMMNQPAMMGQMSQQPMMMGTGMMGTGVTSPTGNMVQPNMMGQPNMQQQVRNVQCMHVVSSNLLWLCCFILCNVVIHKSVDKIGVSDLYSTVNFVLLSRFFSVCVELLSFICLI